jgi:hypothetical protein
MEARERNKLGGKGGQRMGKRKEELQERSVGSGVLGKVVSRQGIKGENIEGKGGQRGGKRKEELQGGE